MPTLNNTVKFLEVMRERLLKEMRELLRKNNRNATMNLSNNIKINYKLNARGLDWFISYPKHGQFVLDNKRNIQNRPGKKAINAIKKWILDKSIPIGNGRLRTPMRSDPSKKRSKLLTRTEAASDDRSKQLTSFAFAIFYKIKDRGQIKAPKVNFLKPYQTLRKNQYFKSNLKKNLKLDGIKIINEDIKIINNQKITIKV